MNKKTPNHYSELQQTLESYIEAAKEGNYAKLCSLLHPNARIYYSDSLDSKKLLDHWGEVPPHIKDIDPEQLKLNTHMTIESIVVDGNIAHVSIAVLTYFQYEYIDFHALLWLENQWQFISKVSHLMEYPSEPRDEISGKEGLEVLDLSEKYIACCFQLDFEQMRHLAHPEARIFIGGRTTSKNLHDHWREDEEQFQGKDPAEWGSGKKIHLLGLEVKGKVAMIKLQFGEKWHDIHQLVKVGPDWLMVNKISQLVNII